MLILRKQKNRLSNVLGFRKIRIIAKQTRESDFLIFAASRTLFRASAMKEVPEMIHVSPGVENVECVQPEGSDNDQIDFF